MQVDMHYYGTYAMARAAGIPKDDAEVIAYAAQFVDDSTRYDSGQNPDGGLLFGITTSHTPKESFIDNIEDVKNDNAEQRRIWVPFHFFPGGAGDSFQEKILCVKDSSLVNEMLNNHLTHGATKKFSLELMGIAAHVYMDTFSHYGFSGMSSDFNSVTVGSVKCVTKPNEGIFSYITRKLEKAIGSAAEAGSDSLGHAGAATFPDRPFLHWSFKFNMPRPNGETKSERDNPKTFLEGCERLHDFFSRYAAVRYPESVANRKNFEEIKAEVEQILAFEGAAEERCERWHASALAAEAPEYIPETWEDEKRETFGHLPVSSEGIDTNSYRFHQAAAYHRYYVLKDLLPAHGIAVY